MLEIYYTDKRTLALFNQGPLGPYFDGFTAYLKKLGYPTNTAQRFLKQCRRFNTFVDARGITDCKQINFSHRKDFLSACVGHRIKKYARCALRRLFDYLIDIGVLQNEIPQKIPRYAWILDPYLKYLKEERGLTKTPFRTAQKHISEFLKFLGDKTLRSRLKYLAPKTVDIYFKKLIDAKRRGLNHLVSDLRVFLRFCSREGYISRDLSAVIPSIPRYRLSALPKGMEASCLKKILKEIDLRSPSGHRDYAMLLLMMAYGVRGSQVAALQLDDISWTRSTIRIPPTKNGKEVILPLLEPVGEAILRYLRYRPSCSLRHVFIALKAPYRPLDETAVSMRVRIHMLNAGVKVPHSGSSTFRHSWAIRALAQGASIKSIADVLGHRCLDTTLIYAKVDLKMLCQVALPWPEVEP